MGVGTGSYMYDVVVKKFTFAVSSPDEFLLTQPTQWQTYFERVGSRRLDTLFSYLIFGAWGDHFANEGQFKCDHVIISMRFLFFFSKQRTTFKWKDAMSMFWATVRKTVRLMLSDRRCLSVCHVCPVLSVMLVYCGQRTKRFDGSRWNLACW